MADEGPVPNPFEGIPFLGDLAKMLQGGATGAGRWDAARQFAAQVATGGAPETNPDPLERMRYEELARVADLRVADLTGLDTSTAGRGVSVVPVTRSEWSRRTIEAWRPLLERLSTALTAAPVLDEDADDPLVSLLQGFSNAFGPVLFGMQAGAMVGHLATRALGQYDLPIPRPRSDELIVVADNITSFGREWSLADDDLRLWICVSEIATHAVLGVPHVRETLDALLLEYAGAFRVDANALEGRLADVDPTNPEALQEALGDPAALLGAISSPEQAALRPRLEALVDAIVGYVDWVIDGVGETLIPSYGMLTEALRRRRVDAGEGDRFVEHLLGLELGQAQYDRGAAFVDGIAERAGAEGVNRLWSDVRFLPTAPEVDAPGLWLARIDLPGDDD